MTGRDDLAKAKKFDYQLCEGRHRRLAKAGSPATARGCGELLRALLAATVAVIVSSSIFRRVLSITCALDPAQKYV